MTSSNREQAVNRSSEPILGSGGGVAYINRHFEQREQLPYMYLCEHHEHVREKEHIGLGLFTRVTPLQGIRSDHAVHDVHEIERRR
jgi:hypothetical protein